MSGVILNKTDEAIEISLANCKGTAFQDALAKVKELPGRRWEDKRKLWVVPPEPKVAERIYLTMPVEKNDEVEAWVRESRENAEQELVTPLPEDGELYIEWATGPAQHHPDEIRGEPFTGLKPHQRALLAYLADNDVTQAIIADDMGLGKTAQSISLMAERIVRGHSEVGPKLIVCPNSVKGVWAREIAFWLGSDESVVVLKNGSTEKARTNQLTEAIEDNAWIITNYEQLRVKKVERKLRNGGVKSEWKMKQPLFEKTEWELVALDEAHRAKNRKAAQTRGVYRTRGKVMLALTGTPIMNSPDELWSLLHWLFPNEYGSYWRFYEQYVDSYENLSGRGPRRVVTGVKNPDALRFELHGRLFRRTKGEVLDLPEKQRIYVPVELGDKQRALYQEAENSLWLEVEQAAQEGDKDAAKFVEATEAGVNVYTLPNGAARTVRLRQVLSSPAILGGEDESAKLDAVVDRITDTSHKQHVVFTEFVGTTELLKRRLEAQKLTVGVYTGEVSDVKRTELEDAFQRGEIDVMVGTIGAMREGITLTAADTVHFIERAWVPGWNEQAEDRLHRIGQKNNVTVLVYEGVDTVDDGKIRPKLQLKERIIKSILQKDHVEEVALTS